jgi:hypothetical protein
MKWTSGSDQCGRATLRLLRAAAAGRRTDRLSLALPRPRAQYNRQERDAKAVQAKVEAATAARVAAEQVGHGLHQMQLLDCIAIERDAISETHRASRTAVPCPFTAARN